MRDSQYNIVSSTQVKIGRKIKTHLWNLDFILVFWLSVLKWTNIFAKKIWPWVFYVSRVRLDEGGLADSVSLHQIRHAAANVLRECWLLHRTNLKKGNRGEHRRHQRCLLEAIRVWVTVVDEAYMSVCLCAWARVASQCPPCAFYGSLTSCQHV